MSCVPCSILHINFSKNFARIPQFVPITIIVVPLCARIWPAQNDDYDDDEDDDQIVYKNVERVVGFLCVCAACAYRLVCLNETNTHNRLDSRNRLVRRRMRRQITKSKHERAPASQSNRQGGAERMSKNNTHTHAHTNTYRDNGTHNEGCVLDKYFRMCAYVVLCFSGSEGMGGKGDCEACQSCVRPHNAHAFSALCKCLHAARRGFITHI